MAQLSRPYQIALAATIFLALVYFVALRPHSSTPSSSSAPVATTQAPAATAASKVYHGSAPGVEGLTRDITRAHGAVAASEQASSKAVGAPAAAVPAGTVTKSSVTVTKTAKHGAPGGSVTVTKTTVHAAPAQQVEVEKQLQQGKVVLVLFWNPKGSDDEAVRKELLTVEKQQGGKIAVHYALADQVSSFGSITKAIQVYQTPTILLVNEKGLTTTLTGFTDAFAIEQTIDEARHA